MTTILENNQTVQDLAKFIKFKNLDVSTPEKFEEAFRDYLINGSVSHWYLQKADDHEKKQFLKSINKSLN